MDKKIQDVVDVLKEYNQEHIINLLNKLEEPKKQRIIRTNKQNRLSSNYGII